MSRESGFSLIELLVALVIMGIVLALGLPAFGRFQQAMGMKQMNAQLIQDVRRARQLAVTRHSAVVVVFGRPPVSANVTSYTIHVDTNGDGVRQSSEMMTVRNLPRNTRVQQVELTPIDSLVFDYSGVLRPGTLGGRLRLMNGAGTKDTLMVSTAGVCYHP